MQEMVFIIKDDLVTTTQVISDFIYMPHKSIIQLVRKYESDLNEFGRVEFQMLPFATKGGIQSKEIALLNEQQTTLLITYMRNSDIVRAFKKTIVRHFYVMRNELQKQQVAKLEKRQSHLPMMNALVEHRAELGKETKQHHFMNENRLCNWAVTGSFDAIDESNLTVDQLQLLAYARRTNESLIMADIEHDERKRMLAYKVESKRRKLVKLLS
jgi:phage regulator Rha-like protein